MYGEFVEGLNSRKESSSWFFQRFDDFNTTAEIEIGFSSFKKLAENKPWNPRQNWIYSSAIQVVTCSHPTTELKYDNQAQKRTKIKHPKSTTKLSQEDEQQNSIKKLNTQVNRKMNSNMSPDMSSEVNNVVSRKVNRNELRNEPWNEQQNCSRQPSTTTTHNNEHHESIPHTINHENQS